MKTMGRILILLVGAVLILVLVFLAFRKYSGGGREGVEDTDDSNGTMIIKSDAFEDGGLIPAEYTCDGENISPSLMFIGVPENAESLALIAEDPDVPKSIRPDGMWTHWLIWNMPTDMSVVGEGNIPDGVVGKNSRGDRKYGGPCPPDKEHRYFFKLFALDTMLDLDSGSASKADLEKAMEGHILAEAQLMGRYDRK